jgi:hypothetical protein
MALVGIVAFTITAHLREDSVTANSFAQTEQGGQAKVTGNPGTGDCARGAPQSGKWGSSLRKFVLCRNDANPVVVSRLSTDRQTRKVYPVASKMVVNVPAQKLIEIVVRHCIRCQMLFESSMHRVIICINIPYPEQEVNEIRGIFQLKEGTDFFFGLADHPYANFNALLA